MMWLRTRQISHNRQYEIKQIRGGGDLQLLEVRGWRWCFTIVGGAWLDEKIRVSNVAVETIPSHLEREAAAGAFKSEFGGDNEAM